jgi:molecular chaperone DnaJ
MAAINEAYRVLRDPASRTRYDFDLRGRGSVAGTTAAVRPRPAPPMFTPRPADITPARYPWKLVVGMAAVGALVVLVGAALYEPADPVQLDNVLEPGSCVALENNNDVREVECTGNGDLVVETIVAFDETCPTGLAAHRDRQGLGMACIARSDRAP